MRRHPRASLQTGLISTLEGMSQTPFPSDMPISHHFGGGVYSKEARVPSGWVLVQHKHEFDHLSILASGTVELLVDGERSELTGPACLTIKANKHHGVKALTDVVWFCIHATECTDPEEADEALVMPSDESEMARLVEALQ